MLQSSASSILNILSSKPATTESAAQPVSATPSQDTNFNKIFSDVERDNASVPSDSVPTLTSVSVQPFVSSESADSVSTAAADSALNLMDGQPLAENVVDAGSLLPFQMLGQAQTLLENPVGDAGTEAGWHGLIPSSSKLGDQLFVTASQGDYFSQSVMPGLAPLGGQLAATDPSSLDLSLSQTSSSPVMPALLANSVTSEGKMLSDDTFMAGSTPILNSGAGLFSDNALTESSNFSSKSSSKSGQGGSGQFVPLGLTQAISHGADAAAKSAAADDVFGNAANESNGLAQNAALTEGLDSQWLERIRLFQQGQQAQQVPGTVSTDVAYDGSSLIETYLANGDMLLNPGAIDADSLFKLALNELNVDAGSIDAGSIKDSASSATNSLNGLSAAQVRPADPALKSYTTMLHQPVNDPRWIESMGEKIVWLSGRNLQAADIHLNPAELGPVEVKIQVQNDQTTVTFTVQNSSVRELLESNVHRLREMMESNGVNLKDVQVGADTSGQQQAFARNGDESKPGSGSAGSAPGGADDAVDGALTAVGSTAVSSRNVIDFYA